MKPITADAWRAALLVVLAIVAFTVAYRVPPAGETAVSTAQYGPVCPAGSYRE